ncbi:hypothetical protein [Nocardioides cynanchi]|uniref:hypothetical protein n=1 Tax=Nocardioides cynanchi TaxID=2558918 RepID=UPI001243B48D|nr:hypothetical protein [Nocardioides cynanchi]
MTTPARRATLLALAVVVGGFALLAASGAALGRPLPRTADKSNAGQYTVPAGVHHVTVVLLAPPGAAARSAR